MADPVEHPLTRRVQRLMATTLGAKSVREVVKVLLVDLFQDRRHRTLNDLIVQGGDGVCIMHLLQLAFGISSEFVLFSLATLAIRFDDCTHC